MQYTYKFISDNTEADLNGKIITFPKGATIVGEEENLTIITLLLEQKIERVGPVTMQREIKS